MSNSWEERQKSMEEGYFIQKDRELIAKMREKISSESQNSTQTSNFDCPKCDGKLETGKFENVQIDVCNKCGGVWLDAGEMQQITQKDNQGWFGRLLG